MLSRDEIDDITGRISVQSSLRQRYDERGKELRGLINELDDHGGSQERENRVRFELSAIERVMLVSAAVENQYERLKQCTADTEDDKVILDEIMEGLLKIFARCLAILAEAQTVVEKAAAIPDPDNKWAEIRDLWDSVGLDEKDFPPYKTVETRPTVLEAQGDTNESLSQTFPDEGFTAFEGSGDSNYSGPADVPGVLRRGINTLRQRTRSFTSLFNLSGKSVGSQDNHSMPTSSAYTQESSTSPSSNKQ